MRRILWLGVLCIALTVVAEQFHIEPWMVWGAILMASVVLGYLDGVRF